MTNSHIFGAFGNSYYDYVYLAVNLTIRGMNNLWPAGLVRPVEYNTFSREFVMVSFKNSLVLPESRL
jgi:hypothetical protein